MNNSGANSSMFPIEVFGDKTNPAKSDQNLWVILDNNFTFHSHVSAVRSSCFYYIRDLRRIRCHRDLDSAKLLATALASSCLNYCNSLLYGITGTDFNKLQRVQNRLARIVTKSPPFTRSVLLCCSLHWLLIKFRILFKIRLLTYKTLHEKQPVYLHPMLAPSLPSHSLRSSKGISVSVPRVKTNTGTKDFHFRALSLSGTTCCWLSVQLFQLLPWRNIWKYISLTWPFVLRHWHT